MDKVVAAPNLGDFVQLLIVQNSNDDTLKEMYRGWAPWI